MQKDMKVGLKWIFCFAWGVACGAVWAQPVTIEGKIDLEQGRLLLETEGVQGRETLAVADFADRTFRMELELDEAVPALLKVEGYEGGFVIMAEPGGQYTAELTRNGYGNIRGGRLQDDFLKYQQIVSDANVDLKKLKGEMAAALAQKHYKSAREWQEKYDGRQQKAKAKLSLLVQRNRDNVLGAYLQTAGLEQVKDLKRLQQVYAGLSEKARATAPGLILAARITSLENVEIAALAPDFALTTPEGKTVSLYGLKAKVKIIDFWASWCGPCRLENPNMVKLYRDFKDKGLEIISVSLDERKLAWTKAIAKDGMTWTQVSSLKGWKCETVKKYQVDAVPFILVLDENNRILAKNIRAEKLRAFVEERLGR